MTSTLSRPLAAISGTVSGTVRTALRATAAAALIVGAPMALTGCGYNEFQSLDEQVNASWSEVLSQYQRRSDLIPNIVNTVKGEASFEQDTLTKVVEARAKATSIQVTPELARDPAALQKFQAAQGELSGALSRLMVVSERYPQLQANQGFRDLRVQLEGTENRITVARNRYIKSVQEYNVLTRRFPSNLTAKIFGYDTKPNFTVQNEAAISAPPTVSFDKPATSTAPTTTPAPAPAASPASN
jgi:LemA protein